MEEHTMNTTTITINGMHCASCETLLTEVLEEIDGVDSAVVSYAGKSATVTHNDKVTVAQLRKAVEAEGYKTA
jgi:copper chaperone CopZ